MRHEGTTSSQFGIPTVSCKVMTSNGILRSSLAQTRMESGDVGPSGSQRGFRVNGSQPGKRRVLPIILACATWGPLGAHKLVQVQCDNSAVVEILRTSLHFFWAQYDIILKATHLPGVLNIAADAISRNHLQIQIVPEVLTQPDRITGSIGVQATRLDISQLERTIMRSKPSE